MGFIKLSIKYECYLKKCKLLIDFQKYKELLNI